MSERHPVKTQMKILVAQLRAGILRQAIDVGRFKTIQQVANYLKWEIV